MRVLLTGGAGYIGSHTAVELINAGHTPIIADNYSNSCPEAVERIGRITGCNVETHTIDMCDAEAVDKLFAEGHFDACIHFAGLKAVGESVSIPIQYYRNNIDSTLVLLDAMQRHGVCNLIFSSSATVYGTPDKLPLTEDSPTGGCTNPYGWTKYMIEQIIRDAAVANPELSAVLLRYFNPVGAHASGLIGEDPSGIPNNLMPFISQVAVGRRHHLSIFGNDYNTPDGTGVRDYIHVVDLAKGHVAALPYCDSHKGCIAVNLGTGTGYSVKQMAEAFAEINGVPVPYEYAPRRPGDIDACYADPTRARELLGWEAQLGLSEMCRDTWNWQKNNPQGYKGAD
ncbi:MAG: UDP-glucose 4-epimerase GalE [Clostridia bacterium]|nr:UDP-glucose 4-epimerase GalE [Clostridia bacterium]